MNNIPKFAFTEPDVELDLNVNLPPIFNGLPLPYVHLDDRRFEELIYSLFKRKIEREENFRRKHNRIQLMQGIGEKGRDCALFKGNIFTGIIQCKKYKKALDRPTCLKEIMKPLLHVTIENIKIPTPTEFEYYLVVTKGVSNPASEMLEDLSSYIDENISDIQTYVEQLKKDYVAFSNIDYAKISAKLISLLKEIRIIIFQEIDIEKEINEPGSEAVKSVFFKVESVVDNSEIRKLRDEFIKDRTIPLQNILENFETASLQLNDYRSLFENLDNSHIKRDETNQIINWIVNPLKEKSDPVLLLVGAPGDGKSVILKDTLFELRQKKIPVIALKADRYLISSLSDLQAKTHLPASIEACLYRVLETEDIAVVLIDQLDALAQSVTSDRTCIDIYNQLIHKIKKISGVRIVISIRKFELEYDYEFSNYRGYEKTPVKELSNGQIASIVEQLGIRRELISEHLYKLLSNANSLNVFCKISKDANNPTDLLSLHDLYEELWNQLFKKFNAGEALLESILFEFAKRINIEHSLTLPSKMISNADVREFLVRNGILFETNGNVQFFHQTFYDYVFAKSFLSGNKTVFKYLQDEYQTIYTRPFLKMILAFLRQNDQSEYVRILKKLLHSASIRWHLKLLILSILGFEEIPTDTEIALVENDIIHDDKLLIPFLEAAKGKSWLNIIIKNGALNRLLFPTPILQEKIAAFKFISGLKDRKLVPKNWFQSSFISRKEDWINACYGLLRTNLPHNRKIVLEFIAQSDEFEKKADFSLRLLLSLKVWDQDLAKNLFEKYSSNNSAVAHIKFSLLEQAAAYEALWVLKHIDDVVFNLIENDDLSADDMTDHYIETISDKLIELIPEEYFHFSLRVVKILANHNTYSYDNDSGIQRDLAFEYYDQDDSHNHGKGLYFSKAIQSAELLCKRKSTTYLNFMKEALTENSETIIRIALISLCAAPDNFKDIAFQLLTRVISFDVLPVTHLYSLTRNLLKKLFPFLTDIEKADLLRRIVSSKYKNEIGIYSYNNERKYFSTYGMGSFGLLSEIDIAAIGMYLDIKKRFFELQRKFKSTENTTKNRIVIRSIDPPIDENSYGKMDLESWENSFLHYTDNTSKNWDSDKGGIDEHAAAFEKVVTENPMTYMPLVKKIIEENKVNFHYQFRGLKGLAVECDIVHFLPLFKKIVDQNDDLNKIHSLIWASDYFDKYPVDTWVYEFLSKYSFLEPSKFDTETEKQKIDQVNESAVYRLMRYSKEESFAKSTLHEIQKRADFLSFKMSCTVISQLILFLKWNRSVVEDIFRRIYQNEKDIEILKRGMQLAQYLAEKKYDLVAPFLIHAMQFDKCQKNASIIIANAFLRGNNEAKAFLEECWATYPKARASMIDVSLAYFKNKNNAIKNNAVWLYNRFLHDTSIEVVHEYTASFLHLKAEDFNEVLPLLKNYIKSTVALKGPGYFFDYITKCAIKNPIECLGLLEYAIRYEEINITERGHYDGSAPVKALVTCCNHLQANFTKNRSHIKKAMNLFDKFLHRSFFRSDSEKMLEEVM